MLAVLDYYGVEYHNNGTDRFKCLCPFHDDHSPSLIIYTSSDHTNESFCCYVDNAAGDPFHFIRLMEGGDFNHAWSILAHINGVEDPDASQIDRLDLLFKSKDVSPDRRSINTINYQVSAMYRGLYKSKLSLPAEKLLELTSLIDDRLKSLDELLSTNPSYVDLHQYYKFELDRLKIIQQSF